MIEQSIFVELLLESWRMSKTFHEALSKMDAENYTRYKGCYAWFRKKVDEIIEPTGLKIIEIKPG